MREPPARGRFLLVPPPAPRAALGALQDACGREQLPGEGIALETRGAEPRIPAFRKACCRMPDGNRPQILDFSQLLLRNNNCSLLVLPRLPPSGKIMGIAATGNVKIPLAW